MTMFQLQTIPIHNRTNAELEVVLEPEGDVIVLLPGARCQIGIEGQEPAVDAVELEYEAGRVTLYASCTKRVLVDDIRVR